MVHPLFGLRSFKMCHICFAPSARMWCMIGR